MIKKWKNINKWINVCYTEKKGQETSYSAILQMKEVYNLGTYSSQESTELSLD